MIRYMSKKSRNVIFSKSEIPTPRITQDWGGGGIGVLLIALLIANALTQLSTQPPYSRGVLKGHEECLLINYCICIYGSMPKTLTTNATQTLFTF